MPRPMFDQEKTPESHLIGSKVCPRVDQGVCVYLNIGYIRRNSEGQNECMCMGQDFGKRTEMNCFRMGFDIGFCMSGTGFQLLIS